MPDFKVSRQIVYDSIWNHSAARFARDHAITFAALVRICNEYNIPRPDGHYWAAIRLGRTAAKTPLPPTPSGLTDTIVIEPSQTRSTETKPIDSSVASDSESSESESSPPGMRPALTDFKRCHPLVRSTWEHLKHTTFKDPQGRLETHARYECLDLTVTKAQVRRALSIFQSIIEACEKERWKVCKPDRDYYKRIPETLVVIDDEEVNIAIIERAVKRPLTDAEKLAAATDWMAPKTFFNATGLLRVGVGRMRFEGRVFDETKDDPLENRIPKIIESLKHHAERYRSERAKWDEQMRIQAEAEQARLLARQKLEQETQRQRDLEQLAARCQASEQVRNLAASVEKRHAASPEQNPAVTRWLAWAHAYADKIDPVLNGTVEKSINGLPPE